jgi:hypothetical protein
MPGRETARSRAAGAALLLGHDDPAELAAGARAAALRAGLSAPLDRSQPHPPDQAAERPDHEPVAAKGAARGVVGEEDARLRRQYRRLEPPVDGHLRVAGTVERREVGRRTVAPAQPPRLAHRAQHELAAGLVGELAPGPARRELDDRPVDRRPDPAQPREDAEDAHLGERHLTDGREDALRRGVDPRGMPLAEVPLGKDAVELGHLMRAVGAKATSIPSSVAFLLNCDTAPTTHRGRRCRLAAGPT